LGIRRVSISLLSKKKWYSLFLLAGVLAVISIWGTFFFSSPPEEIQEVKTQQAPPPPKEMVISGKVAKGGTLSSALRSQDIPADFVAGICNALKPVVNLRKVKPGDIFELRLSPEGALLNFSYQASPIDIYQITIDA
jgi:hypothetical protein